MPNDTLRQDSETPYIPARKGPAVKRPIRLPRSEEPGMLFDVAFCNIKDENSSAVSSKRKSVGNRWQLRRTCWFRRAVVTP